MHIQTEPVLALAALVRSLEKDALPTVHVAPLHALNDGRKAVYDLDGSLWIDVELTESVRAIGKPNGYVHIPRANGERWVMVLDTDDRARIWVYQNGMPRGCYGITSITGAAIRGPLFAEIHANTTKETRK